MTRILRVHYQSKEDKGLYIEMMLKPNEENVTSIELMEIVPEKRVGIKKFG